MFVSDNINFVISKTLFQFTLSYYMTNYALFLGAGWNKPTTPTPYENVSRLTSCKIVEHEHAHIKSTQQLDSSIANSILVSMINYWLGPNKSYWDITNHHVPYYLDGLAGDNEDFLIKPYLFR